uniref:Uncharacterized protein n=1 Tax=Pseudomonas fluorescens (strain SBW25) TaxID=216595 RepID=A0A0G4E4G8_PSEFS|nr:hypothetical protein [Pseudomonas fluorescens]CEK42054.1 hypothetical protein PQBR57_0101 [Pseudomonas fluorescens SBW25]
MTAQAILKNTIPALLALTILAGCEGSNEKALPSQATGDSAGAESNCVTNGPNSPIVTGKNSVVIVNGKTYTAGQRANCAPASKSMSTHGSGSPIVTGAGSKVISTVER